MIDKAGMDKNEHYETSHQILRQVPSGSGCAV